jgi:hypothetical protein
VGPSLPHGGESGSKQCGNDVSGSIPAFIVMCARDYATKNRERKGRSLSMLVWGLSESVGFRNGPPARLNPTYQLGMTGLEGLYLPP